MPDSQLVLIGRWWFSVVGLVHTSGLVMLVPDVWIVDAGQSLWAVRTPSGCTWLVRWATEGRSLLGWSLFGQPRVLSSLMISGSATPLESGLSSGSVM
ncbi:hypothetical protein [Mycobacterium leprae]|uniref:hypothetical protein n=1 Tax=Mycobacterium leprae TaxID=1769 RepID=UPI000B159062